MRLLATMNTAHADTGNELVPICMVLPTLENLPGFAPPRNWSVRWYQPGDEAVWFRIQLAAERQHEITLKLFRQQFGQEQRLLGERQCYLLDPRGQPAGTATAWFDDNFEGGRWGRVHWVAILPRHQGQGLGSLLMTAVCHRLRALGHTRAFLRTSANRIPAIKLYLRFGFEPHPRSAEEERLWRGILAQFGRAA